MLVTNAERFATLFQGSDRAHAEARMPRDAGTGKVKPSYVTVPEPAGQSHYKSHLAGVNGLVLIPIRSDLSCMFGTIDIDVYTDLDLPALEAKCAALKLPLIVCRSKSGGAHLYFLLRDAATAARVRALLAKWAAALGYSTSEIFPKQIALAGPDDVGNGINLPYFDSERTTRYAVQGGKAVSFDEFLIVAEGARTTIDAAEGIALPAPEVDEGEHTDDAPKQVSEKRNIFLTSKAGALHNLGITAFDDKLMALRAINQNFCDPPLPDKELHTIAKSAFKWETKQTVVKELQGFPVELVVSARELLARNIPPREFIIESVLTVSSLAMVYGWRGLGKTWVVMDMSVAVARGGRWLKWSVPKARRVLYIDGEMPAADLQARVRALCGDDVPELLELLPSEFFYGTEQQPFTLNNIEHQARLRLLLEQLAANGRRPEMIVFDNLSSMSFGVDENSNSEQDAALAFLRELRHLGHAVVLVHHAGKGGDQRGASRHEDFLDLSIKLAKPETETADSGAHFVLEFVKVRGKKPQPSSLDCVLAADQHGRLEWIFAEGKRKPAKWVQALKYVADKAPQTQKDVAEALGVSAATIGKHLERAREKDLLDGMMVTEAGGAYLRKVYEVKAEGGADDPEF